ncbi:MAG: hypothetical protein C0392_04475 [Syntrophus sp. (in: bacteria)]|nr:hypothetical protein [Syntrophus sp. (in: bacteria)]
MALDKDLYEKPRNVTDINDCIFYHTMDIPEYGYVEGEFDLRGNEDKYLGGVDFKGKRVLEIGTASGYLCFHMERQGAEVVAFDLNENYPWDIVPFAGFDSHGLVSEYREGLRKINNAFWLCHKVFNSRARAVYGTVYNIPREIGEVDIATFCATLVHFQNPFAALQGALSLTREKVIVTDVIWDRLLPYYILSFLPKPHMTFIPEHNGFRFPDTWWFLPPALIKKYLGVLGFRKTTVKYFFQKYRNRKWLAYNVVGTRTL